MPWGNTNKIKPNNAVKMLFCKDPDKGTEQARPYSQTEFLYAYLAMRDKIIQEIQTIKC